MLRKGQLINFPSQFSQERNKGEIIEFFFYKFPFLFGNLYHFLLFPITNRNYENTVFC